MSVSANALQASASYLDLHFKFLLFQNPQPVPLNEFLRKYRLEKYESAIQDEGKFASIHHRNRPTTKSFKIPGSGFESLEDLSETTEKDAREMGADWGMRKGEMYV